MLLFLLRLINIPIATSRRVGYNLFVLFFTTQSTYCKIKQIPVLFTLFYIFFILYIVYCLCNHNSMEPIFIKSI